MVDRARPLLGTFVSVRVEDAPPALSHAAIDAAFDTVATVHRLMSFQDPDSELSRLNGAPVGEPVALHAHTLRVLRWSLHLSALTRGRFDVTTARAGGGFELLPRQRAVRTRPVQLDLSGIAKGYAVDLAIAQLRACGVRRAVVNAGGDLRVLGPHPEHVLLRAAHATSAPGLIELAGGALATSDAPDGSGTTVTVCARRCLIADALTKFVLSDGASRQWGLRLLRGLGARAWYHSPDQGWRELGTAAACADTTCSGAAA